MKLSFKKQKKETGLRAVGNPYPNTEIKGDGKVVGLIDAPNWMSKDNKWKIRLCIKVETTPQEPCPFGWITLKMRFDDEKSARAFIQQNFEEINTKFDLFQMEDY